MAREQTVHSAFLFFLFLTLTTLHLLLDPTQTHFIQGMSQNLRTLLLAQLPPAIKRLPSAVVCLVAGRVAGVMARVSVASLPGLEEISATALVSLGVRR